MPAETKEKCGVGGVYIPTEQSAAFLTYKILQALQHRGQDSAGITISDGLNINYRRGFGLVKDIFEIDDLLSLQGHISSGHVRYATDGGPDHIQPVSHPKLQLSHNGNLVVTDRLVNFLIDVNVPITDKNDSELMHSAILYYLERGASLEEAVIEAYPLFEGSFSLVLTTKDKIAAVRDKCGIRPLCYGELNGGIVFSSETVGLDAVGAKFVRDIRPGEMFVVNDNKRESIQIVPGRSQLDVFEIIYFSSPDSYLFGQKVHDMRVNIGKELAKEYLAPVDVITGVPNSGNAVGFGYSKQSGIPYHQLILKNPKYIRDGYALRTFILDEYKRVPASKEKYIVNPDFNLAGLSVAGLDDSIVRGNTDVVVVDLLRRNGAKRIYIGSGASQYLHIDKLGIATHNPAELIARNMSLEQMRVHFGADGLGFISIEGLMRGIGLGRDKLSFHVFDGIYPDYKYTGNLDKIPVNI